MKQRLTRVLCIAMVLLMLAACGTATDTTSTASSKATASTASKAGTSSDSQTTADVSDVRWQAVAMRSQKMIDAGIEAGEGSQVVLYVTYSYSDPSICWFGTDVGGLYRSADGGSTWEPATVGIAAWAGTGVEVDPYNSKRVLVVGSSGSANEYNTLYLSTDGGDSFRPVVDSSCASDHDNRAQIAYDASSYDKAKGYCKVAYWCRETNDYPANDNSTNDPALFRTEDGGETWTKVNTTEAVSGAQIAVDAKSGAVYTANSKGAFRSTDGGKTFTKIMDGLCTSVTNIINKPGTVWLTKKDGVYVSDNSGDAFKKISESGYPVKGYGCQLKVSPADPKHMLVSDDQTSSTAWTNRTSTHYLSTDGGKTWTTVTQVRNSFYTHYNRVACFAWHPTDAKQALMAGGAEVMRSFDGGLNWVSVAAGFNGGCWQSIVWNVNNPNLMILPNQDEYGAYTVNGGKVWVSLKKSTNKLTPYTYGAYICDANTLIVAAKDTTNQYRMGKESIVITRSTDGGATFQPCGVKITNGQASKAMGVVGNDNIVMLANYRSTDKGATWTDMKDVDAVCTYDPKTGTLYGTKGGYLLSSTDQGASWTRVCVISGDGTVTDVAYGSDGTIWATINSGILMKIVDGKADYVLTFPRVDGISLASVTVDLNQPNVIYAGGSWRSLAEGKGGVFRSTDGGKTWGCMVKSPTNGIQGVDGLACVKMIRCHPTTGDLYAYGACRGLWKTAAYKK